MPVLAQERLVVVLAGEAHPEAARLPQVRQGATGTVDPGPAAAGPDLPAQDHGLLVRQPPLEQKGPPGLEPALDHGLDRGPLGAVAHQLRIPTGAHQQRERIHQQGLARPGLAREHREARPPVQGQILHQGQVLNSQRREHRPV